MYEKSSKESYEKEERPVQKGTKRLVKRKIKYFFKAESYSLAEAMRED